MSELALVAVLFGSFLLLLLLGTPIAAALGIASLLSFLWLGEDPMKMVQIAFNSVGSFPLMALPAFILAGALMEAAGISRRLVAIAESFAGPISGGLSAAAILACIFFGAISGSGPATTAAVGMLMIPAMKKRGYDSDYASAVVASSGGLGIVIPPSIPMVIFGVAALGIAVPPSALEAHGAFQTLSIPKLFVAGVVPGLFLASALLLLNYVISRKRGYKGRSEGWSTGEIFHSLRAGVWSIAAPLVILGGIYSGVFTPTESAVVAIFYTLFVGLFVHGELRLPDIQKAIDSTTLLSGRVLLILFSANLFGRLLVENRIPTIAADAILGFTTNTYAIWVILLLFLLFIGMFMETLAAILILTPVLLPIAYGLGIDPVHFGIVMVCTLAIGFSTPPLGENLFVASGISHASFEDVTRSALPFVMVFLFSVLVLAFVPSITLGVPAWLGY